MDWSSLFTSISDFIQYLGETLEKDMSGVTGASDLREDLAFDSLAMLEVLIVVEELGVEVDEARLAAIVTIGDLFDMYIAASES